MQDAAIISGSLVDVRNVGTHKSVKLTIHVPEELAMKVVAAFGWPTGAAPVLVAIACLDDKLPRRVVDKPPAETSPRPMTPEIGVSAGDDKPPDLVLRREKSPAQIAGYLCTLGSFQTFLREKFTDQWVPNAVPGRSKEDVAKETLYDICTVTSRTQLTKDNTEWHALQLAFRLWENHPELEDA
jgi:hypothetical protein